MVRKMTDKLLQVLVDFKTPLDRKGNNIGEFLTDLYSRYLDELRNFSGAENNPIVDIYNNMNDEDKAGFTLETAKEMVKDQIDIDFSHGREPQEYDPQLFYEVIREFIEQDAEDGE